jgi:predicted RNA binding protein YcfA (HicA-like mRNA interferase family)
MIALVNRRRLLRRLLQGSLNVSFGDFVNLVEGFGFRQSRVRGSHQIFIHPYVPELVNLQELGGEAKPYQVRQFLKLVERYDLRLEDEA